MALFIIGYLASTLVIKNTIKRRFNLRRNYLRLAITILNVHFEKSGELYENPALYVCNHRSIPDPLFVAYYVDAFVIAKAEIGNYPILKQGAELTGVVYVKREDKGSRSAARAKMVKLIKEGDNVLVYPEGTTSNVKGTLPYKLGTFIEAAKNNFPIVPVALEYREPKDHWSESSLPYQYFRQFSSWKTEAKLIFGDPIFNDDGIELKEIVQKWTNNQLLELQKGWSRAF